MLYLLLKKSKKDTMYELMTVIQIFYDKTNKITCAHYAPIDVFPKGGGGGHTIGIRKPKVTTLRNLTDEFGAAAGP